MKQYSTYHIVARITNVSHKAVSLGSNKLLHGLTIEAAQHSVIPSANRLIHHPNFSCRRRISGKYFNLGRELCPNSHQLDADAFLVNVLRHDLVDANLFDSPLPDNVNSPLITVWLAAFVFSRAVADRLSRFVVGKSLVPLKHCFVNRIGCLAII